MVRSLQFSHRFQKKKAVSLGVQYIKDDVVSLTRVGDSIQTIGVKGGDIHLEKGDIVVNSSGARSSEIMRMIGEDIPVRARRRCIFVFDCHERSISKSPLTIDITGVYFRPEGKYFIGGVSPPEDNDPDVLPDDFKVDYDLWENTVWPTLAQRIPAFEEIKLISAWAGHYDYNIFDQNAILGRHPRINNLFLATGFSGHGIQQSPAVGRGMSELILYGKYISLDLSEFCLERIEAKKPLIELNIV